VNPASPHEIRQPNASELEALVAALPASERADWRRHHAESPESTRVLIGLDEQGQPAGAHAGRRLVVRMEGARAGFTLVGDSFRPGASVAFDRAFGQTFGGAEEGLDLVHFGLADAPAWDLARAEMRYDMIRTQLALVLPIAERGSSGASGLTVEEVAAFPEAVDALFERAAGSLGAVAERTAEALARRFPPDRGFRVALARHGGGVAGYAVFRAAGPPEVEGAAWLWDWLVPPGEEPAGDALRAWAADCAASAGADRLAAVFPDSCSDWIAFQRAGFRAHAFPRFLVARSYAKQQSMRWLYHHWYYTLADLVD